MSDQAEDAISLMVQSHTGKRCMMIVSLYVHCMYWSREEISMRSDGNFVVREEHVRVPGDVVQGHGTNRV